MAVMAVEELTIAWPFDAWYHHHPSHHHRHYLGTRSGPLRSVCTEKDRQGVACNCRTKTWGQPPP